MIAMSMFAWGAQSLFRAVLGHRKMRSRFTWSANSGCGRFNTQPASARSTSCTCRSGRKIKLIMTSEDTIHDFFVPAFRIKADVVPGKYTTQWFEATKPGTYHLFCAEYCGMNHSGMIGSVIVMEPTRV